MNQPKGFWYLSHRRAVKAKTTPRILAVSMQSPPESALLINRNMDDGKDSDLSIDRKCSRGFYFRETSQTRIFVKIKPSRNGEITLSFTGVGKPCPCREL